MHLIADALSHAPLFAQEEQPGLDIDTAILCFTQTSYPSIRLIYDSVNDDYRLLLDDVKTALLFPLTHKRSNFVCL